MAAVDTTPPPSGQPVRPGPRPRPWLVGLGVVLLATAGYGALAWAATGRAGGAPDLVALADRADRPIVVVAAGATLRLDPRAAGLALDPEETRRRAGFALDPRSVWTRLTGDGAATPAVRADPARLRAALGDVARTVDRAPRDAAVTFRGTEVRVTPSVAGRSLDRDGAAAAITGRWLRTAGPIVLPVTEHDPRVSTGAAETAAREVARPAVSGPVTLTVGDRQLRLAPADLAAHLRFVPRGTRLVPDLDGEGLRDTLLAANADLLQPARDATVVLRDGQPTVVPGVPGTVVDPEALARAVLPALTSADRTARLDPAGAPPAFTTAQAEALGIREVIGEFATTLTPVADRTHNIELGAGTVDGTVLRPGQSFSLNGTLGERTAARGYRRAGVIEGNRMTSDYGGGVSQLSTTIFNATFFAGLRIDEHHAHSLYISRYPEGRETTLNWGTIDLRFTNDSGHGVLIHTWVADNQVHAQFWGTKKYVVTADKGPRYNQTSPTTRYVTASDCTPQSAAPGWTVDVHRYFDALPAEGGRRLRAEGFTTVYAPHDRIVCGPPPGATPSAAPATPQG